MQVRGIDILAEKERGEGGSDGIAGSQLQPEGPEATPRRYRRAPYTPHPATYATRYIATASLRLLQRIFLMQRPQVGRRRCWPASTLRQLSRGPFAFREIVRLESSSAGSTTGHVRGPDSIAWLLFDTLVSLPPEHTVPTYLLDEQTES